MAARKTVKAARFFGGNYFFPVVADASAAKPGQPVTVVTGAGKEKTITPALVVPIPGTSLVIALTEEHLVKAQVRYQTAA